MLNEKSTIAVIPARGGSKGIPRKNLRPIAGNPLLYYSITACREAETINQVIVSTDDEEIALFAERFGAVVMMRPEDLADDHITLDPVIAFAVEQAEKHFAVNFELIATIQPTSPLINADDIDKAMQMLALGSVDSVISVVDDTHLRWRTDGDQFVPEYTERLNRQMLPKSYRETGAVIACTSEQLRLGTRIGERVKLLEIPPDRGTDIDSYADLALCEFLLKRKRIVFTVIGYQAVGLGHVYRVLSLANELTHCEIYFVCESKSDLAAPILRDHNYSVHVCENGELAQACVALEPDVVINDILDTEKDYINSLKSCGAKVVNFEDLGSGIEPADVVINALYSGHISTPDVFVGEKYFCLRDEFLYIPKRRESFSVQRILLTFGGVDEGNLTVRCLTILLGKCEELGIEIDIVTGPGYQQQRDLQNLLDKKASLHVHWAENTKRISDFMLKADLAITSGGRTVLELASLGVPTLVICQNERETKHTFASRSNGIMNLGHRDQVNDDEILTTTMELVTDLSLRTSLTKQMAAIDLTRGKSRVIKLINELLEQ